MKRGAEILAVLSEFNKVIQTQLNAISPDKLELRRAKSKKRKLLQQSEQTEESLIQELIDLLSQQEKVDPDPECPICLDPIPSSDSFPCSNDHVFHFHCLAEWTKKTPSCPICKVDIPGLINLLL
jgi:hypothetical protein